MNKKRYVIVIVLLIAAVFVGLFGFTRVKEIVEHKRAIEHIHDKEADVIDWIYSFGTNTEIDSMEAYELGGILVFRVTYSYESKYVDESSAETIYVDGAVYNMGDFRWHLVNYNWPESAKEEEKQAFSLVEDAIKGGIHYAYSNEEISELAKYIELNDWE